MRKFEVEYITTLPPWRFGHEMIEAEDLDSVKKKFHSKKVDYYQKKIDKIESDKMNIELILLSNT